MTNHERDWNELWKEEQGMDYNKIPGWEYRMKFINSCISEHINTEKYTRIVDFGCGMGCSLHSIIKSNLQVQTLGIDESSFSIDMAKQILPKTNFLQCNLCKRERERERERVI